ncbi:MAG: hypothetical protein PWR30_281 [Candidatus Woesearchaeota archaeon]|nr:hypothetical protein [Candidatus Woesearchaeota archaeon]
MINIKQIGNIKINKNIKNTKNIRNIYFDLNSKMMFRSVLRLGENTFVISLPKQWVEENGINKGDQLNVRAREGEISFSLFEERTVGRAEIDLGNRSKSACWKVIFAAYIKGYEEIVLKGIKDEQASLIEFISNQLIGMTISSKKEDTIILRELSKGNEKELEGIFRRIYLLGKDVVRVRIEALHQKDFETLNKTQEVDWTINKFVLFCLRIVNKSTELDSNEKIFYYTALTKFEQIGDVFADFFVKIGNDKITLTSEEERILKKIYGLIEELSVIVYKPQLDKILNTYEERKKLEKECDILNDNFIKAYFQWLLKEIGNLIEAVLPSCIEPKDRGRKY